MSPRSPTMSPVSSGACSTVSRLSARRWSRRRIRARRGPLVCVRSNDVAALVEALAADRIVTSSREDKLRVALHLYNVDEDVDALLAALERNRALLD